MTIDELRRLCEDAARDLAGRADRPLPTTVVVPGPSATAVTSLPEFPDDDVERFDLLSRFAADRMRPVDAPCYGFLAEAEAGGDDVVVVVYGARRQRARIAAAPLGADGEVGQFTEPEELDPTAMPFLSPLQHAADAADPGSATQTADSVDIAQMLPPPDAPR